MGRVCESIVAIAFDKVSASVDVLQRTVHLLGQLLTTVNLHEDQSMREVLLKGGFFQHATKALARGLHPSILLEAIITAVWIFGGWTDEQDSLSTLIDILIRLPVSLSSAPLEFCSDLAVFYSDCKLLQRLRLMVSELNSCMNSR